jgi:DNA-binding LacI/PurR family transcriptional regulator
VKKYKDLKINANQPLQPQLTMLFRQLLASGQLKVGERIPPLKQLAEIFNTNYFTVNTALKPLVDENFLERKPRVGTFVRYAAVQPTRVGIYNQAHPDESNADSIFNHRLISALNERLTSRDIQCKLYMDSRPGLELGKPLPQLEQAVRNGEVQQILVLQADYHSFKWLMDLGIPLVAQSYHPDVASVITDLPAMIRAGVCQLKKRGCRKVAMISSMTSNPLAPWRKRAPDIFADECSNLGLDYEKQHLIFPYDSVLHSRASYGVHMFNWLWESKNRPDGILLHPDSMSPGVINAVLSLQIPVPEKLKIVMTRNRELPFFLPFPVDVLDFSIEEQADQLIELLYSKMRGDKVPQQYWKFYVKEDVSSISARHLNDGVAS